jgi:hypothetical protein
MQEPKKIKLDELSKNKAVEEVAKELDKSSSKDEQTSKLWSQPFIATGSKPGTKPPF